MQLTNVQKQMIKNSGKLGPWRPMDISYKLGDKVRSKIWCFLVRKPDGEEKTIQWYLNITSNDTPKEVKENEKEMVQDMIDSLEGRKQDKYFTPDLILIKALDYFSQKA